MKEILRYRKAAYLAARLTNADPDALAYLQEIAGDDFYKCYLSIPDDNYPLFAPYFFPYLPGLTTADLNIIFTTHFKEVARKRLEREKNTRFTEYLDRLFPLSNPVYDRFAKYVWEKRGMPMKDKAPIGARWGRIQDGCRIKRFTGNHYQQLPYISCQITTNVRNKKILRLSIAH